MNDAVPCCDVCGVTWDHRRLEMTYMHGETTTYCDLCKGLVEAGLIRPEQAEDGSVVYRQWHMGDWTPGELIASAKPDPPARARPGR